MDVLQCYWVQSQLRGFCFLTLANMGGNINPGIFLSHKHETNPNINWHNKNKNYIWPHKIQLHKCRLSKTQKWQVEKNQIYLSLKFKIFCCCWYLWLTDTHTYVYAQNKEYQSIFIYTTHSLLHSIYLLLNSYNNTNYIIWPEPLIRRLMSFIHMSVELIIILK